MTFAIEADGAFREDDVVVVLEKLVEGNIYHVVRDHLGKRAQALGEDEVVTDVCSLVYHLADFLLYGLLMSVSAGVSECQDEQNHNQESYEEFPVRFLFLGFLSLSFPFSFSSVSAAG